MREEETEDFREQERRELMDLCPEGVRKKRGHQEHSSFCPYSPPPADLTHVSPGVVEGIQTSEGSWARWLVVSLPPKSVTTASTHPYCAHSRRWQTT